MQRIQKRRDGQRQTQNALIGLLSAVSMTRIGLTQLLPLCGSAAWWLSAACMLPGLCVYGALRLLLRRTHTRTLTDCARKLLGNFGGILIMLTLTLPLLLDGIASLTALITFFTEGIGARGSQFTLTLLTASVMLIALNRDGLPRGVYLLRHVLLVAAAIIAINALLDAHPDVIVPIMAVCYFVMTLFVIAANITHVPAVLGRIFSEAFGLRQAAAGGFGAVLMNGIKRGLFSNEAGSGSAPCAAAAASCDDPVKMGLVQALGVLIDTIVICSCTAFVMLLAPASVTAGLTGMDLLQAAVQYHLGSFGVIFIAVTLALFSFSTFLGILFYARSNVAYLFGDRWLWQTLYKLLALVMLLIGGMEAYTVVWDLGDVGIGLMTIFNLIALYPLSGEAIAALHDYERRKHLER